MLEKRPLAHHSFFRCWKNGLVIPGERLHERVIDDYFVHVCRLARRPESGGRKLALGGS